MIWPYHGGQGNLSCESDKVKYKGCIMTKSAKSAWGDIIGGKKWDHTMAMC